MKLKATSIRNPYIWLTVSALIFISTAIFGLNLAKSRNYHVVDILVLGDSISHGYYKILKDDLPNGWRMDRPYQGLNTVKGRVRNWFEVAYPVNCRSTEYSLVHIDVWLEKRNPTMIIANWGMWDSDSMSLSRYEENLVELVGRLKSKTANVFLVTTTPILNPDKAPDVHLRNEKIKVINEIIVKNSYVLGYRVIDVRKVELTTSDYSEDKLHLSTSGYAVLANYISNWLAENFNPSS